MNEVLNYVDEHAAEHMAAKPSAVALAAMLKLAIEEVDYGTVMVDARAQVRLSNRLAWCELLGNGPIGVVQGRLHAHTVADRVVLTQAIADALRGRRSMVTVGHNGSSVVISVLPAADDEGGEALALLFFGKRPGNDNLTIDFYARTHGLTSAETTVLKLLWSDFEPKEIARHQGVAVCTVRSHICNIRLKTQTASIRSLLKRLAALPPITSAMKGAPFH